jgi:hypothetical protein
MGADPVRQPLRPGRLGIGEVGRAQDGDEDPRLPDLAGQPVDHHRRRVAGVIHEQLVAAGMGLAHGDRQLAFPGAVEFAEPGIAIPVGMLLDVFIPQDRQRDVLAPQLAVDASPIRFGVAAMALLRAGVLVQLRFQLAVGDGVQQRPVEARGLEALDRLAHRRRRQPRAPRDLVLGYPGEPQTQNLAHAAHGNPPCWHRSTPQPKPKKRTLRTASGGFRHPSPPGRHHPGTVGED